MTGRFRLPPMEVVSALCKIFAVEPVWLIDEVFFRTEKSLKSERLDAFQDIELLSDGQYEALLKVKQQFMKMGVSKINDGNT